jgi:hypothetical protein
MNAFIVNRYQETHRRTFLVDKFFVWNSEAVDSTSSMMDCGLTIHLGENKA